MDGRASATIKHRVNLDEVPRIRRAQRIVEPLLHWQIVAFVTMWITVLFVAGALEPPPANPDAAPVLGAILTTLFLVGAGATALLALTKNRLHTASASLFTGAVAVAITVACPIVGHHHLAPWWFAQLGVVAAPGAWSLQQFRAAR
jgi:hypothetical protein